MSLSEAIAIQGICVDLTSPNQRDNFRTEYPWSSMPPGGYVAIVEAFARFYVYKCPTDDDPEISEHLELGLVIFAENFPDWAVTLISKQLELGRAIFAEKFPDVAVTLTNLNFRRSGVELDAGQLLAASFASKLCSSLLSLHTNYGIEAFRERVAQLRSSGQA